MATISPPELTKAEFWRAVLVLLEQWTEWWDRRPFRGECPVCAVEVVVVHLDEEDRVLELGETLPVMRCPRCAGNVAQGKTGSDPRSKPCWRCGGLAVIGSELPSVGVLVREDGGASWWTGGDRPKGGAVMIPHWCGAPP